MATKRPFIHTVQFHRGWIGRVVLALMQQHRKENKIAKVIETTLLPLIVRNGMKDVWAAIPRWRSDVELPERIKLSHKGAIGKRVAIRNVRAYGTHNIFDARWPKDNLVSARAPRIYCILSASAKFQISDYFVECRYGSILIIPPGTPYRWLRESSPQPQETLQIMPYSEGMLCWHTVSTAEAAGMPKVRESSCSIPQSQVVFPLSQFMEEMSTRQKLTDVVCESWLKIVLSLLYRELHLIHAMQTGHETMEKRNDFAQHPIQRAEEYLRNNVHRKVSIDDMARYTYISRTAFTTQFRTRTGKTFNNYLQDLRFETACQLLREGDLTIQHVARAVGLRSNRLREVFHERLATTPSAYRQQYRTKSIS